MYKFKCMKLEFISLCNVTELNTCTPLPVFGLFPGNTCRGHGDGLL